MGWRYWVGVVVAGLAVGLTLGVLSVEWIK